jgi:ribonucleoside-diphosphate reductase alpha chain
MVAGSKVVKSTSRRSSRPASIARARATIASPEKNPALKREVKLARRDDVPDGIQARHPVRRQGYRNLEFDTYDTDWDSEAYLSVSGQNSNNSVRVTDAFLHAVENDGDWSLTRAPRRQGPQDAEGRELWDKIGYAAWACADPGIQYHTTINDWHTCPESGPIRASNPCSEYMFLDDTACNLASLNLLPFRDPDGARSTSPPTSTRSGCGRWCSRSRC